MHDLYSENDLLQINTQLKKRYLVLALVMALFVAAFIVSMTAFRVEWVSVVIFFLLGAAAVFIIDLFCLPLHRYRRLVTAALTGRSHTDVLVYNGAESETSLVEGVRCRGLLFLGEPEKHGEREQRYYWDAEFPLPTFRQGEDVTLKYTGRNIIGYQESSRNAE